MPAAGGPLAVDQVQMPAKQGLWAGEEGAPCRPGEDAAGHGENDAIGGVPPQAGNLAFEDAELMTESEDLGAFLR